MEKIPLSPPLVKGAEGDLIVAKHAHPDLDQWA